MNASLITRIEHLLRTGMELVPEGGSEFSGYNAKKQSTYLLWRKNCLDALNALEEQGPALCARITADEDGMYFYHSSAQHIVTVLEEAREAAHQAAKAAEALERARREEEARQEAAQREQALREEEANKRREQEEAAREAARQQIEALEAARAKEEAENARQEEAIARARAEAEAAAASHEARVASAPADGSPKLLLYSLANHVMLKQVQKFFNDLSLDYSVVTHSDGLWDSLDGLNEGTDYYAVFLLSDRYHGQELMALGYLAGRYRSIKLCCIHAHTLPLGDLLPGVSRQAFTVSLDEIKLTLMRELKAAGCPVSI